MNSNAPKISVIQILIPVSILQVETQNYVERAKVPAMNQNTALEETKNALKMNINLKVSFAEKKRPNATWLKYAQEIPLFAQKINSSQLQHRVTMETFAPSETTAQAKIKSAYPGKILLVH
jgi:hypothetical protein